MSVPNQIPYIIYNANGFTTVFPFEFYIISASDIQITMNGDVVTSGYTVSGVGNVGGGDVVFLTPPANGTVVMLERVVPTYRLTDYQDNGDLLADTVNKDFDRLWMAIQRSFLYLGLALRRPLLGGPYNAEGYRISEGADPVDKQDFATKNYVDNVSLIRALRVPESSVNPIPPAAERANRLLAFNYSGQPIVVLPESGSATDVLIELASTESGKGDNLLGVKQPVAGAADQTQHDKNAQVINIMDFNNIYGDGVCDDTAGLINVVSVAESGTVIRIPGRTFLSSVPLSFTKPVTLLAETGARIKLTAGDHDYVAQIDLRDDGTFWGYGSHIENLILDGSGHAKDGLSLRGVIGGVFNNIRATNISRAGLHEWWTQLCVYSNFQCSHNIEAFTTKPVHGILADCEFGTGNDRGSSANTYINPTIEHTSGSGICGVFTSNNVFINGTSEGNYIGIEFGHATDVRNQAVGNTVTGMDLEVNSGTDILSHKTTYANDFIGLKAGYSSPALQVQGSYGNSFIGGTCSGIDFNSTSHDNRVIGMNLLGSDSFISDSGTRNTYEKIFNMSLGTQKESTNAYPSRAQYTISTNGTIEINPFLSNYIVISTGGSPINIASASKKLDGAIMDITIHNISGSDDLTVNWSSDFRVAGWTSPKTGRHRSIRFAYDANYGYWSAISMSQVDIES